MPKAVESEAIYRSFVAVKSPEALYDRLNGSCQALGKEVVPFGTENGPGWGLVYKFYNIDVKVNIYEIFIYDEKLASAFILAEDFFTNEDV